MGLLSLLVAAAAVVFFSFANCSAIAAHPSAITKSLQVNLQLIGFTEFPHYCDLLKGRLTPWRYSTTAENHERLRADIRSLIARPAAFSAIEAMAPDCSEGVVYGKIIRSIVTNYPLSASVDYCLSSVDDMEFVLKLKSHVEEASEKLQDLKALHKRLVAALLDTNFFVSQEPEITPPSSQKWDEMFDFWENPFSF